MLLSFFILATNIALADLGHGAIPLKETQSEHEMPQHEKMPMVKSDEHHMGDTKSNSKMSNSKGHSKNEEQMNISKDEKSLHQNAEDLAGSYQLNKPNSNGYAAAISLTLAVFIMFGLALKFL